jgi:hypothetical protein
MAMSAPIALPPVHPVMVYLIVHCVKDGDVVAFLRPMEIRDRGFVDELHLFLEGRAMPVMTCSRELQEENICMNHLVKQSLL